MLLLALCVVGAAVLDTAGRAAWSGVVDRAEGVLRADLLAAALQQPVGVLAEQAVGEVLDRVDDDTYELGTLLRRIVWDVVRTSLRAVPMWVVAGTTWWPAWLLFPLVAVAVVVAVRPLTAELARRKVAEEVAWTDHAAAMEEGVAARDDLRSSLGQAFVLRRCAELSSVVMTRVAASCAAATRIGLRAGLLLHALLAGASLAGIVLVAGDRLSTAALVTLFLVTSAFVGQVDQIARHLPELQAGLGALTRLRSMLAVEPEPAGGRPVPEGPLDLTVRGLRFRYDEGSFALQDVDLHVPAGRTLALVGRTGSGKSTLAALLSRAVEPPPGTVLVGGADVLDLDLQQLRAAVGVVTQRTEVLAATLADNITLFADLPRPAVTAAVEELGLGDWVAGLPDGLDTVLGPGGTTLSAGEEQLVAFARLLVRSVQVVVLDEATARMDPVTEARVVRASERLLVGRTGVVIAHRLATTARADLVAVLDGGRVVQQGPRDALAAAPGAFRDLLSAAGDEPVPDDEVDGDRSVGTARRAGTPRADREVGSGPGLARSTASVMRLHPRWGAAGAALFLVGSLLGAYGAITGWVWGRLVEQLQDGRTPVGLTVALTTSVLLAPLALAVAFRVYLQWWAAVLLRVRLAVLHGQTTQHRLAAHPRGRGGGAGHGQRALRPVRRPLGRLPQRPRHRRRDRPGRPQPARRGRAARGDGRVGGGLGARLPGRRAVRRGGVAGPRGLRPVAGVGAGVGPHGEAGRGDPRGAPPPRAGRRGPGRGRGARAPGAGRARRHADRAGAVRRRHRLAGPAAGRLGPGDRAARDDRGQRLRLVRSRRRGGHHRGAGRTRVEGGDQPAGRRDRPHAAAAGRRPAARPGACARSGPPGCRSSSCSSPGCPPSTTTAPSA